jgi:hypothetical protein
MEEKIPSPNGRPTKFYLYEEHQRIISELCSKLDYKPSESLRRIIEDYKKIREVLEKNI